MKMNEQFQKLCTPAKIYFSLAVLSILLSLLGGIHIIMILSKLFCAFIWTYILSWLCKKGFTSLSWFLVLLPFIVFLLVLLGIMKNIKEVHYLNPLNDQMGTSPNATTQNSSNKKNAYSSQMTSSYST
jgi:predicted PurR-regulated permease PerM